MSEESTLPVWLVKNADGRYLVRKPYDGTWDFTSPTDRFATPLTESMARYFAGFYGGTMVRDTYYVTRKPYRPSGKSDTPISEESVHGR